MTSKRGKNKEVRYAPQESSVTDILTMFWVLCALSENTHATKRNLFVSNIVLILVILQKSLRNDDLRAKNFSAHYVIRIRAPILKSQPPLDQWKHAFYSVHCIKKNHYFLRKRVFFTWSLIFVWSVFQDIFFIHFFCNVGVRCRLKWISGQNDFKLVWFVFSFVL